MSIGGFHALSNAWLALLAVPLILFYFLKLKRPRQEVASLALWRQVMQDRRVNSPFQRFRRNLLLLLQLLILALLVGAAAQPFIRSGPADKRRVPVLVDCSASMAALDRPGGVARLDEAKRRIREMINGLGSNQELCLVSFARAARKRCGFTSNKRLLREALEGIEVEAQPADLEDALRLAQGMARAEPFEQVLLYTDGNFAGRVNVDLSFKLSYQRIPVGGANLGITALAAQRAAGGGWNVFVQVDASDGGEGSATVEMTREGASIGRERVTLVKGRGERLLFHVPGEQPVTAQVRVSPDAFDSVQGDNTAEIALPAARPLRAFVSPGLSGYRRALDGLANVRLEPEGDAAQGNYDLVIAGRMEDMTIPAGVRFSVGQIPSDLAQFVGVGTNGTRVVDWRRDADLLRHVELSDLVILDQPSLAAGVSEGDLENAGYEVLVHGHEGPLLVQKKDADVLTVAMLFHSDRSTLPYRVGFPILVANLAQMALDHAGLAEVRGGRSVLSAMETSLSVTETIEFNERLSVASAPVRADRSLWPWLLLAALGVLLAEWWLFHRRAAL